MSTIDQLLGTSDKLQLLRFFLFHPDSDYTSGELSKLLGLRKNLNRPLKELGRLGCLLEGVREETGEATYRIQQDWLLYPEFRALFLKAQLLVEHDLVRRVQQAGTVRLLILGGIFVGDRAAPTDLIIVGTVNRKRIDRLCKQFSRELDREINYTIFTAAEYRYRKNVGDRFIYSVLESRHLVAVDTLDRRRSPQKPTRKSTSRAKKK